MGKKILILCDRFYPENFIINDMAPEFKDRIGDIEVLTQNPSYPYGKVSMFENYKNRFFSTSTWQGISVRRIFTIQGYRKSVFLKILHYLNFVFLCTIYLVLFGWRYKSIFIFQTGPLIQAIPAVISKKLYHQKIAIWTLDLWPDAVYASGFKKSKILSILLNNIVHFIYSNCNTIFVSSRKFTSRISEFTELKKLIFMPQWPVGSFTSTNKEKILEEQYFHFTFAGNIARTQNLEIIINSFAEASKSNSMIRLNIFGDGSNLDYLRNLVEKEKFPHIFFGGRLPQDNINTILNQSDVLIISLKPDPLFDLYMPLKFSSYLKARKPIFAIMNGDVKTMVEQYEIGITSNPSHAEEIKDGFLNFVNSNQDKLNKYSENTEGLLNLLFDRDKIINNFFTNFRDC